MRDSIGVGYECVLDLFTGIQSGSFPMDEPCWNRESCNRSGVVILNTFQDVLLIEGMIEFALRVSVMAMVHFCVKCGDFYFLSGFLKDGFV